VTRRVTYRYIRPPHPPAEYTADVLAAGPEWIILEATLQPSRPLRIDGREVLAAGYRAVWFLHRDQPWDVARIYRPDGTFMGYYADVTEPIGWSGDDPDTLQPIVDLFLDVWIAPDGRAYVLDRDEFEEAVRRGVIGARQEENASVALEGLLKGAREGDFPPEEVRDFRPLGTIEGLPTSQNSSSVGAVGRAP